MSRRKLFEVDLNWWTPAELRRVLAGIYRELARRTDRLFAKGESAGSGVVEGKRYRDPDNQFNTWNGRGRRPKWLKSHLENGRKLEDLEVKECHRATPP